MDFGIFVWNDEKDRCHIPSQTTAFLNLTFDKYQKAAACLMLHFQGNAYGVCVLCHQVRVEPEAIVDASWGHG